jgi:hypothetical protein
MAKFNFDPDSVKKVHERLAAERAAAQPDDKSILESLPKCWLVLDSWRWMPGYRRPQGSRQRPQ